jgi:hypothetical protein
MTHAHFEAQSQAMIAAGLIVCVFLALSGFVIVSCWRAGRDEVGHVRHSGMHTQATMRSQEAYIAGNRAAARTAPLHVVFNVVMSAALFAAAWHGWRAAVGFIGGAGVVGLIGVLICTAVVGNKAARRVAAGPHDGTSARDWLHTARMFGS